MWVNDPDGAEVVVSLKDGGREEGGVFPHLYYPLFNDLNLRLILPHVSSGSHVGLSLCVFRNWYLSCRILLTNTTPRVSSSTRKISVVGDTSLCFKELVSILRESTSGAHLDRVRFSFNPRVVASINDFIIFILKTSKPKRSHSI